MDATGARLSARLPASQAAPTSLPEPCRARQGRLVLERYAAAERITAATRLLSWSLAKSLTTAMVGMRVLDGAMALRQLVRAPGWSAAEARRRNITGAAPGARNPTGGLPEAFEALASDGRACERSKPAAETCAPAATLPPRLTRRSRRCS